MTAAVWRTAGKPLARSGAFGLGILAALLVCAVPPLLTSQVKTSATAISVPHAEAGIEDTVQRTRVLAVPYLSQGPTNWCFHTSLAMVLQYYGKAIRAEDIALAFRHQPEQSMSLVNILLRHVDSYVSSWSDLAMERHGGDWGFGDYQHGIEAGTPIIVSTFGVLFTPPGHTLVVVGYAIEGDERFLYVHDPSGAFSSRVAKTGAARRTRVSWQQFEGFAHGAWSNLVIHQDTAQ